MVGKMVKLDMNTDSRARGRFARMAVYVELDKPLVSQILINGLKQNMEYESLSTICFSCGRYGHMEKSCMFRNSGVTGEKSFTSHEELSEIRETIKDSSGKKDENYGPWMIVERKSRLLNNRDSYKNIDEGVLSRNKGKEIFNGKYTKKEVGSFQKDSLDLGKSNNNNNCKDKEVGHSNNKGSNTNGENGPISRSSLNQKRTKENLPDSKKQTSYLGLGDSSNAQARVILDLPGSVTMAQQKAVVAGCSSSSMVVVDEQLPSTGEMDLLLEVNSGLAQGSPVLEGDIRKEERLAVGNLNPGRHMAVVFYENSNSNKTNPLPNSNKGLIPVSNSGLGKGFGTRGKGISKKRNKVVHASNSHFKFAGSQRVPLKESIEQIAQSLLALSKSNLESVEANVLDGQIEGSFVPTKNFIRAFCEYNEEHKSDIACLVETKVSGKKANDIIEKLGFNFSHQVEAVGFSGGIWVGWKDSIHIRIIQNHPQFIFLCVNNLIPDKSILISFLYGSPNGSKRKLLWEGLQSIAPHNFTPWLIMGEFNAILSLPDKRSPSTVGKRCNFFGNFVESCELQDLGYSGPSFTWQRGCTLVRLDRA
ncbi:hypothetical protein PVK06_034854 [Gossypium arboreum]|uniref:CCHC-type domain-containing protein n=1 Tax=Gossypium arboreum TaxID=29729 RepID=A0ABR0NGG2_GOSAR|nr:hypothetical protein PVK06_034854 [Gossypium arboreum]